MKSDIPSNSDKPSTIDEYVEWLKDSHNCEITSRTETYYKSICAKLRSDFESSAFWQEFVSNLKTYDQEYLVATGYPLIRDNFTPIVHEKPYKSFLLKTYRKNVIDNKNWPDPPNNGWLLPENWFYNINDIIRTLIEVKYLDGVEFILEKLKQLCNDHEQYCEISFEARDEGYYAVHVNTKQEFEVPRVDWDTELINVTIEIQITTQLQEVIRKLLHSYYEQKRVHAKEPYEWQWDYKSDEFAVNYLGHILHYVEGMIMDVREKHREG